MKRILVVCVFMLSISIYSQNQDYRGRVGINTLEPKATLDISAKSNLPESHVQGVSFPNITIEEREKFQHVKGGTMIYNTDKQCLEICIPSGNDCEWQCMELKRSLPKVTLSNVTMYIPSVMLHQGKIDNQANKIKVKIPYRGGLGNYKSITIESTAVPGQDNQRKKLVLKIPEGSFDVSGNGSLEGEIEVDGGGEYLVKQLSIGDQKAIAEFVIPTNSRDGIVSLKSIGGIGDRCFNKTTRQCWGYGSDVMEHQFIYFPVDIGGVTWLSQNLGAEYSRVDSDDFAPGKQDFSVHDNKAYGSLFQWQRPSDGHELIDWDKPRPSGKHGISNNLSGNSSWIASHNRFVTNTSNVNPNDRSWLNNQINRNSAKDLWQVGKSNNPCPEGFHVPTITEWNELTRFFGASNNVFNNTTLRLSLSGLRTSAGVVRDYGGQSPQGAYYWSSNQHNRASNSSSRLFFNGGAPDLNGFSNRVNGHAIRCRKD